MVPLPKLPDPESLFSVIDKASDALETGLNIIDKVANKLDQVAQKFGPPDTTPATAPVVGKEALPGQKTTLTTISQEPEPAPQQEDIATACVSCAVNHFSTSAGLLNEAVRFKAEGITSNEVLDRIAKSLQELNALERVDLTPEKLQSTPDWERSIADEALRESRKLRHRLEGISSMEEIEKAAADAESYYKKLNRQWYKGRFAHLGKERVEAIESRISPEDKERIKKRAEEIIKEA